MGKVRGVDISSWQHPNGAAIDWAAVRDSGVGFVVVKATQGASYTNPWLARDLDDARAEGLLVGAYHFVVAGVPAAEQAAHFLAALMGQRLDLGCWLDWELDAIADYEVGPLLTGQLDAVDAVRPGCGVYCDDAWRTTFARLAVPVRRLWLAAPDGVPEGVRAAVVQTGTATIPGIVGPVDVDELYSTRGVDIPTSPPSRPVAAPVDTRPDNERAEDEAELHQAPVTQPPSHPEV